MLLHEKEIFQMIAKNNGFITVKEVTEAGIPRRCLSHLTEVNQIFKVDRGIYMLPETWEDEMFFLQYRFSKGIFSHETALYLYGMTDRTPGSLTMTFPFGYNTSSIKKQGATPKICTVENYSLGISELFSPAGNVVKVYDIERTLCDMVKETHQGDIQVINHAMRDYVVSKEKDIAKLMEYAAILRVKEKVLSYMEILL